MLRILRGCRCHAACWKSQSLKEARSSRAQESLKTGRSWVAAKELNFTYLNMDIYQIVSFLNFGVQTKSWSVGAFKAAGCPPSMSWCCEGPQPWKMWRRIAQGCPSWGPWNKWTDRFRALSTGALIGICQFCFAEVEKDKAAMECSVLFQLKSLQKTGLL